MLKPSPAWISASVISHARDHEYISCDRIIGPWGHHSHTQVLTVGGGMGPRTGRGVSHPVGYSLGLGEGVRWLIWVVNSVRLRITMETPLGLSVRMFLDWVR